MWQRKSIGTSARPPYRGYKDRLIKKLRVESALYAPSIGVAIGGPTCLQTCCTGLPPRWRDVHVRAQFCWRYTACSQTLMGTWDDV